LILGPLLTAARAQAACNGAFREFATGLTIEEGDTPHHLFHPYRPAFLSSAVRWTKDCGTWAIGSFELHTKVQPSGGPVQPQDCLVGRPAVAANGQQRAGYSTGGDDVFVVPVLLLAANDAELGDPRVWDVKILGRQPFQQLQFRLPDSSIRDRWKFQPVSAFIDAGGVPEVVHFVVSCGEASCTPGELAEAASLAAWRRRWPPR
jgi:hypothetical protein